MRAGMSDGANNINMAELARRAGVSISTVSRALAGHSVVNRATREKIAELARELDFRPNIQARNLRLQKTHAIAVLMPLGHQSDQHLTDPFFLSMLGYLADAIADRGYDMLLSKVIPTSDYWLDDVVGRNRVDGVVIIGQSNQAEQINRTAARYQKIVVWGAQLPGQHYVTVGTDNRRGGALAAEHLIARRRKQLMFLGEPDAPEISQRQLGFLGACERAGMEVSATTLQVELVAESAYQQLKTYFASGVLVDGIFAASDVIAMAAIRALSECGKQVPGDVSVVGYDDVILAAHTTPPLTTVRQDLQGGAALLIDALFALMAGQDAASVEMPPELIIRASS
jgi:DNA-binding LacI/PurR family transcriptional regulator